MLTRGKEQRYPLLGSRQQGEEAWPQPAQAAYRPPRGTDGSGSMCLPADHKAGGEDDAEGVTQGPTPSSHPDHKMSDERPGRERHRPPSWPPPWPLLGAVVVHTRAEKGGNQPQPGGNMTTKPTGWES